MSVNLFKLRALCRDYDYPTGNGFYPPRRDYGPPSRDYGMLCKG